MRGAHWLVILFAASAAAAPAQVEVRKDALRAGDVEVPIEIAIPAGKPPFPAVLYVHARRGFEDPDRAHIRALAEQGFLVVAPDWQAGRFIERWPRAHDPQTERDVAAIAAYAGHMQDPNAPEPDQLFGVAPEVFKITAPVLFLVGEQDFELRRSNIGRAFYALYERGVPAELQAYPLARRAFDFRADATPEEKIAARHARERTRDWLRRWVCPAKGR